MRAPGFIGGAQRPLTGRQMLEQRRRPDVAAVMPDGTPVYVMPPQGRMRDTPAGQRAIRRTGKGLVGLRPKKVRHENG